MVKFLVMLSDMALPWTGDFLSYAIDGGFSK